MWVGLLLLGCTKHTVTGSLPVIKNVTRFSATITWTTQKPVKGRIQWKDAQGKGNIESEHKRTTLHSVTLTGLLPEKVYTYSINTMPDTNFTFRTAPKAGSPFRFCIINQHDFSFKKIESFCPDFIILTDSGNVLQNKMLQHFNSQTPVLSGPARFEWSNAYILVNAEKDISLVDTIENNLIIVVSDTAQKPHNLHNKDVSLIVFHTLTDSVSIDTASSYSLVSTGSRSVGVEVQGDEVRAGFGQDCDKLNFLLKKGTMTFEKTCVLCRRLMEQKSYKKSVEYYQKFILENPAQKLHDDALYQIAFIYDTYLFDFKKAITSYTRLLSMFPGSQLSQIAEIRLNYLNSHKDYHFEPLTVFEKNKLNYRNKKDRKSLETIEKLLQKYSDCSIRNEILMWLGSVYSHTNWKKSISFLAQLTHDSLPDNIFYDAAFKIGTILYNANKFKKSEVYHRQLLQKFPDNASVLQIKIDRSIRNQKREILSICSILAVVAVMLITFFMKPLGFSINYGKSFFWAGCMYGITALLITGLFHESLKQTIPFTLITITLMMIINFVSRQLLYKLNTQVISKMTTFLITGMVTLLLTIAAFYISLKQFHYLFVFERMFQ